MLTAETLRSQIGDVTPIFSFDVPGGRVGLVLALTKAYSLCAAMVEKLPHTSRRMALFQQVRCS